MSDVLHRIDIVANQSVEEDIIEHLQSVGHGESFTYIHPVFGRGDHGRREMSAVWPETNVLFIVYMNDDSAGRFISGLRELRERFPREGIRCWKSDAPAREL